MGVKSTVDLSREQAIERAVMLTAKVNYREMAAIYAALNDSELEGALENLNDEVNGGEGFENYSIQS